MAKKILSGSILAISIAVFLASLCVTAVVSETMLDTSGWMVKGLLLTIPTSMAVLAGIVWHETRWQKQVTELLEKEKAHVGN